MDWPHKSYTWAKKSVMMVGPQPLSIEVLSSQLIIANLLPNMLLRNSVRPQQKICYGSIFFQKTTIKWDTFIGFLQGWTMSYMWICPSNFIYSMQKPM